MVTACTEIILKIHQKCGVCYHPALWVCDCFAVKRCPALGQLLGTPCLEATEFFTLGFLTKRKKEVRMNNCLPRAFATCSQKAVVLSTHFAASADPWLQTLPTCHGRGLGSPPAPSSHHAGKITFNKTPFRIMKECSPGVPAAAFVAAAESPSSGHGPRTSGFWGGISSTGGVSQLKETEVQAGEGVGVAMLSGGFFLYLA